MKKLFALLLVFLVGVHPVYALFPTQSLDFEDTSGQYAHAADSTSLDITGNLTLEGWFKFETLPGDGQAFVLLSKYLRAGDQRAYQLQIFNNAGTYELRAVISSNGATTDDERVSWTPSTGTWYHLALTFTAASSTYRFYVDGTQQGADQTGTQTSIVNSTARFFISANDGDEAGNLIDGKVVLVRVWSSVRSQTDINNNKCTILGATANLAAEWTLDNVLTDNSGNSNTLTAVNSPTFGADVPSCTGGGGGALAPAQEIITFD